MLEYDLTLLRSSDSINSVSNRGLNNINMSNNDDDEDVDTTRPTAVYTASGGRSHTMSVAIPASLIHNAKAKLELRTYLAGEIARALSVFCVDEVVIFDDGDMPESDYSRRPPNPKSTKSTAMSHPGHFLQHILSYMETPPFLRKRLFPFHENLEKAGILQSLDIPSHLRANEWCEYREGISTRIVPQGTYVDCGLQNQQLVKGVEIPLDTRVTLKLTKQNSSEAVAASPLAPREDAGYYWGYVIREAASLSTVFTECGYEGGYDLSIGTSERGNSVTGVVDRVLEDSSKGTWQHLILVFGGMKGLEEAAKNDEELVRMGIGKGNVKELFDHWVNLLPGQGSRTIRTEEALWMGLMATRRLVDNR